jgi:hypothetical protein
VDADGHRLAGELAGVFDDELVRQRRDAESLGDTPERRLVGHGECHDDRRRMARGFRGRVGDLSDLRTVWEVGPN